MLQTAIGLQHLHHSCSAILRDTTHTQTNNNVQMLLKPVKQTNASTHSCMPLQSMQRMTTLQCESCAPPHTGPPCDPHTHHHPPSRVSTRLYLAHFVQPKVQHLKESVLTQSLTNSLHTWHFKILWGGEGEERGGEVRGRGGEEMRGDKVIGRDAITKEIYKTNYNEVNRF